MQILKAARGGITGNFGDRGVPGSHVPAHLGTDIGHGNMSAADLAVSFPAAGTITAAGWMGTYGNRVVIDHGTHDGAHWESLLAHLASFRPAGTTGQPGDPAGVMGNTGGSWPVHLHQELRRNGVPINAADHFAALASFTPTALHNIGDTMAFQVKRQQTPGTIGNDGRTYLFDGEIISHLVHDQVVSVNNYVGVIVPQQVSADDLRRLAEARGFSWATVNSLAPGTGTTRAGVVFEAGRPAW